MVISFRRHFLFIHVPKCAGESITEVLLEPANGGGQFLRKHSRYAEAERILGDDIGRFRVFAVVRNPFDQVLSFYEHLRKPLFIDPTALERQYPGSNGRLQPRWASELAMRVDFTQYVRQVYGGEGGPTGWMKDCCDWLTDASGRVAVERVLRHERLAEDFAAVARELGLEGSLPWRNASRPVSGRESHRERYDEPTRRIIAARFRPTLDRFGYSF